MLLSVRRLGAVLDASVLIQAVVREKYSDDVLSLVNVLDDIFASSLIFYEVGNALVLLMRRGLISREDALRKFEVVQSIPTLNVREPALTKAVELSIDLGVTLYDASYLELALESGVPLITADTELCRKGKDVARVIHASEVRRLYL